MLCHRARNPARSRPRRCAISSSTEVLVEARPLRRFLSIAIMRACLVSGSAADLEDAGADRLRGAGLAVFRAVGRLAAFRLDLGLVMGSSEVQAAPSAAPPQPRPANHPAGQDPKPPQPPPSHHSNAPIKTESQSNLS